MREAPEDVHHLHIGLRIWSSDYGHDATTLKD
jgi:hypothetical protein